MDRLRQRADFLAVANGARVSSAAFALQGRRRDDQGPIRVGFTVTKKNGTATERNRIRRRLREVVRRLDVISMRPHHDYVLVGRREALTPRLRGHARRSALRAQRLDRQPANGAPPDLNDETAKPMNDNRNTILAVILSGLVLIAWQYFYNVPQMEKQRVEAQKQAELQKPAQRSRPRPAAAPGAPRRRPARRRRRTRQRRDAAPPPS